MLINSEQGDHMRRDDNHARHVRNFMLKTIIEKSGSIIKDMF